VTIPRIFLRGALAVALLAGCGSHTSTGLRAPPPQPGSEYRIGVEDVLAINVWREPDLGTTAPVRPDGKVTVPVAGEIQAAGRTANELELELAGKLAHRIQSPVVSVVVKEVNAARVFVLGEVGKPGAYPLRGSMTILQALALAGGLTEFAKKGDIVIVRRAGPNQTRLQLDYDDALAGDTAIELMPGDTVVVP